MRHLLVAGLALAVLAAAPAPAAGDAPAPDPRAALDPHARQLVDGEWCAGLVVGLVDADGGTRVLAWGETTRGGGQAPDGDTVFEIGSATKVFTSLLLADLVARKQVKLDTPVARLLPARVKLPRGKRAITLLDLATHTSGLPRMPDNFTPADLANPYADYTVDQLHAFLAGATLARQPGEAYEYSNLGAGLLGHALALRAKQPYEALVTERITAPLGMKDTAITLSDGMRARLAQGYDGDGEPARPWDLPTLAGAGALRSTANDLLRFLAVNLGHARPPGGALGRALALAQTPRRDADRPGERIGLGWHLHADGAVWHNGQTGGYHSYLAFHPARRVGVVVLASGGGQAIDDFGAAALAAAAGDEAPVLVLPASVAVPEKTLATYVGEYELAPGFAIAVTRAGGRLYGQATGQPRFRLFARSPTAFALRVVEAEITFEIDGKGRVTGLVLHQNGMDLPGRRKP